MVDRGKVLLPNRSRPRHRTAKIRFFDFGIYTRNAVRGARRGERGLPYAIGDEHTKFLKFFLYERATRSASSLY